MSIANAPPAVLTHGRTGQLGQLYIVKIRARIPESRETVHQCWVLTGISKDDVERKLPYIIDKSSYTNVRIVSLDRVKPNAHCVYTFSKQDEEASSSTIVTESDGGTQTHEIRTNQPANRAAWRVALDVTVRANDSDHALRRVGNYLAVTGLATGKPAPWYDGARVASEELGEGTSHTQQSYDNPYTQTSIVGLPRKPRTEAA